jgi:dihydrofolate reductase
MAKIEVFISVSLDGVMQAPARPDEDTRGGFTRGGWAAPYADPSTWEDMGRAGSILLGRRTYEDFYDVWPKRTDNPFTPVLNASQKYVASRTLEEPLPWENSILLGRDVPAAIAELKENVDEDIVILGSGKLVRSLMPTGLIDRYVLSIHPLVLGAGQRLFVDGGPRADLELEGCRTTATGVMIATFAPAGRG